jgi:c-di-GMP-binding flagellar brake protein YcgR
MVSHERRAFKRVTTSLHLLYRHQQPVDASIRVEKKENHASILDISEGGLALVSGVKLPLSSKLWIQFTLTLGEESQVSFYEMIETIGEVRNLIAFKENTYRIGIQFLNLDAKCKDAIARFVGKVSAPGTDHP